MASWLGWPAGHVTSEAVACVVEFVWWHFFIHYQAILLMRFRVEARIVLWKDLCKQLELYFVVYLDSHWPGIVVVNSILQASSSQYPFLVRYRPSF